MQNPNTGHMEALAADEVERMRAQHRCVLTIGQEVELEGGRFRVAAIGRRFVRLEGLPGTTVGA